MNVRELNSGGSRLPIWSYFVASFVGTVFCFLLMSSANSWSLYHKWPFFKSKEPIKFSDEENLLQQVESRKQS